MGKAKEPSGEDESRRDWHRLFGLGWADLLADQPVEVEWEFETTRTVQYLDVLIVRTGKKKITVPLPDGFAPLAAHNLITFKAFKEALDGGAIEELLCHFINYRKFVDPKGELLDNSFRLFGVSVHFPHNSQHLFAEGKVSEGVYRFTPLRQEITVVVTSQLPREQRNALLCLFSTSAEHVQYGRRNYAIRSDESRSLLSQLLVQYFKETDMPRDMKAEFARIQQEAWVGLSPELRRAVIAQITPEDLAKLPAEDRREVLAKLPAEDRREFLAKLTLEDRIAGLSAEESEELMRLLEQKRATTKPK